MLHVHVDACIPGPEPFAARDVQLEAFHIQLIVRPAPVDFPAVRQTDPVTGRSTAVRSPVDRGWRGRPRDPWTAAPSPPRPPPRRRPSARTGTTRAASTERRIEPRPSSVPRRDPDRTPPSGDTAARSGGRRPRRLPRARRRRCTAASVPGCPRRTAHGTTPGGPSPRRFPRRRPAGPPARPPRLGSRCPGGPCSIGDRGTSAEGG